MKKNFVLFSLFLFAFFILTQSAQAQDENKNYGFFKLGYRSKIESSLANKFTIGGGLGIKLLEKQNFFIEPSLALNFSGEQLFAMPIPLEEGSVLPVWASPRTILFDINGLHSFRVGERINFSFGGGLGLLRNWLSSPDKEYYKYYYGLRFPFDNHFTKNVSFSARYFLGEELNIFVGTELKNYWVDSGSFRLITGQIGFRF